MSTASSTPMTDDARKRLAVLDSEGYSASAIAKALWDEFGIYKTRNAVIGMIHRMGLREQRARRRTRWAVNHSGEIIPRAAAAPAAPKPAFAGRPAIERKEARHSNNHVGGRALRLAPVFAPVAPMEPTAPAEAVGLIDLEAHHCRAVVGRGADGLAAYCGAQKTAGSYCAEHYRLHYERPSSRSEAA